MSVRPLRKKDALQIAFASERSPRAQIFTIPGIPIPLQRPRMAAGHVWDSQKHEKMIVIFEMTKQLGKQPVFAGPLSAHFEFYMPMPRRMSAENRTVNEGKYYTNTPDVDNLVKFYLDCASNDILYHNDSWVVEVYGKKVYSNLPRTVFTLTELV